MRKYAQGLFQIQNPQKYVGNKTPTYRSSWEFVFMQFCDNNPNVLQWASEAVRINYRNPLTGKNTIYVPDFLITYGDANGKQHAELIEVKPRKETSLKEAKSVRDQASAILNMAKWQAARTWCQAHNMTFRVVTEDQIFHQGRAK
jgi:TnsA endonuclease N terminal